MVVASSDRHLATKASMPVGKKELVVNSFVIKAFIGSLTTP